MRLDLFLRKNLIFFIHQDKKINALEERAFSLLPRAFWQEMIKKGYINYPKKKLKASSRSDLLEKRLLSFDWKKIKKKWLFFLKEASLPYPLKLTFIRKTNSVYALNKPAGVSVNPLPPSKEKTRKPSLFEGLLSSKFSEKDKIKIIHRLDKETSGVILFARNKKSEDYFRQQFKTQKIKKTYLALTLGDFPYSDFVLSSFIGKKANNPLLRAISAMTILNKNQKIKVIKEVKLLNPKEANTSGKKITTGTFGELSCHSNKILAQWLVFLEPLLSQKQKETEIFSLIELKPETGRTHQLRVQLSFLGYPIVGDGLYGGFLAQKLNCHFLHAFEIKWFDRDKKEKIVTSSKIILSKNYFMIE